MTDATDTPEFIIAGEWRDPDPNPILGPRLHPYGLDAYEATIRGIRWIFRDKAAHDAFMASR